ncbi:NADH-quinone oxidoreductase subunit J [bacterium]|nr:NADH-quinone oxidoreductase subunit J [bacterium]
MSGFLADTQEFINNTLPLWVPWIWFWFFAFMAVGGSLGVVLHRKIVYNAVFLALALVGTAGLYVTLNAEFLGIVQVLLYVGGVIILLLFGILLTRGSEKGSKYLNRNKHSLPAGLLVLLLSGWMAFQFYRVDWPTANDNVGVRCVWLSLDHRECEFRGSGMWPRATVKVQFPQLLNTSVEVGDVGRGLMLPYLLTFELASLILLVAMVGVVLYLKDAKPIGSDGEEGE